jgi:hypothetical protein
VPTNFENLALLPRISVMKCSRFYLLKDLLSFPVKPLAWKTAATEGYPIPATLSFSSAS